MIVSFLLKVLFLYFLYIFFRGLFRAHSTIKVFKEQVGEAQERVKRQSQGTQDGVFEAEYTVVNESKDS